MMIVDIIQRMRHFVSKTAAQSKCSQLIANDSLEVSRSVDVRSDLDPEFLQGDGRNSG